MMARRSLSSPVKIGFEEESICIAMSDIQLLRPVTVAIKSSAKYKQIAASIREVGIVEPPIVARDPTDVGNYLLLDGHLRIEILKDLGKTEVVCLVSIDDEAFT